MDSYELSLFIIVLLFEILATDVLEGIGWPEEYK